MLEVLANYVFFPLGIYALSALLLIIIFFFLKKKTTISKLPTIMFLLKEQGKKKYKWFPRIPFNLLLLLYLLLATVLAVAIMEPFYHTDISNTKDHSIIIIDNSASMQTADRFEQSLIDAKKVFSEKTTIITTSPKPITLLEKGSYLQARSTLSNIALTDATTPLKDTILFLQSANYEDAALHIYSDFLDDELDNTELEQLFGSLGSLVVVPHIYKNGQNNVGFVESKITKEKITLLVRNFQATQETVTITVGSNTQSVDIPANDIAPVSFSLPTEPTVIRLAPDDEVMSDNAYYLSAPSPVIKNILYITEKPDPFTTAMLGVIDFIAYDTYAPPGTVDAAAYDAFIIEDVDPTKLLPSNVNEALDKVSEGGVLVIKMGNKLRRMTPRDEYPFTEILPKKRATIQFLDTKFTQGITASSEEEIFPITLSENTTVLLETLDGEPVIVYKQHGQGGIVYYGIVDPESNAQFKQTYAYPILFQRIFKQNFQIPTLLEQQKVTGEQWIGSGVITGPNNEKNDLPTTLANAGFYNFQGATYAVNLLSLSESQTKVTDDIAAIQQSSTDAKTKASLLFPIIMFAVLLILAEIHYLKKRGEY